MSLSQQQKFAIKDLESKYGDLRKKYVTGDKKEEFLNELDRLREKYNLSMDALDFFDNDMLKQMYQLQITPYGYDDRGVPNWLTNKGYSALLPKEKPKAQPKVKALRIKKDKPLQIEKLYALMDKQKPTKPTKEPKPFSIYDLYK